MTVGRLESCQWSDFESCCGELVEVQEASSKGFELAKAQLTRPSQNNSLRMHCRVEEEQRLEVKRLQTVPHLKDHKTGFIDLRRKPELTVLLPARLQERSHSEGEGLVARPVGGGHRQLQRANTLDHILCQGKMITWSFHKVRSPSFSLFSTEMSMSTMRHF